MNNEVKGTSEVTNNEKRILVSLLILPCLFVFAKDLDNDIWFLLNSGRYVMANGIPHIEPFTIHQDWEFVMQQWLSAVIFWLTYSNFGEIGLRVLVVMLYGLIVLLAFRLCLKISKQNFVISFGVTSVMCTMLFSFMTERPYVFSCLILLAECYMLESYVMSKDRKYLYALPLLSGLMVNLHAAMWPMMFVIMLPYILESFVFKRTLLSSQGYDIKEMLLTGFTMIAFGFCNPYGISGMTYVFRSYGYPEINAIVSEMYPIDINSVFGKMFYLIIMIHFCIYCYSTVKNGHMQRRYLLLTLGTAFMALSSVRSISIYAICGFYPLAYYLRELKIKSKSGESSSFRKVLVALLIILSVFSVVKIYKTQTSGTNTEELNATIDYIINNNESQNAIVYTGYNDGNLVEFRGLPTYLDTRAEVFVKKNNKKYDVMKEYYLVQAGKQYYKSFLDKYGFTHIIVRENDILATYLSYDDDYTEGYSNESYFLYVRK